MLDRENNNFFSQISVTYLWTNFILQCPWKQVLRIKNVWGILDFYTNCAIRMITWINKWFKLQVFFLFYQLHDVISTVFHGTEFALSFNNVTALPCYRIFSLTSSFLFLQSLRVNLRIFRSICMKSKPNTSRISKSIRWTVPSNLWNNVCLQSAPLVGCGEPKKRL